MEERKCGVMQAGVTRLPSWVRSTDRPIIVRTRFNTSAENDFEGASPHLISDHRELFLDAIKPDITVCKIERAQPIFREVVSVNGAIPPETCTPYVEANGFGYYIKN